MVWRVQCLSFYDVFNSSVSFNGVDMSEPFVLVIDDDRAQRVAYKRILRRSHYRVCCAASGKEGLHMLMSKRPDLVLLDVMMPVMSGHEFLRRLKQLERRRAPGHDAQSHTFVAPPVIFVSGRAQLHDRIDGLDAGASDYVTKPFDAEDLRARIRRLLRDDQRHRVLKMSLN